MHPLWKILLLIALLVTGMFVTMLGLLGVSLAQGYDLAAIRESMMQGAAEMPVSLLRPMLWLQALAGFILPGIIFLWICYRQAWRQYLQITIPPRLGTLVLSLVIFAASMPLVYLAYELNTRIPLPDALIAMEEDAAALIRDILVMENFGALLLTLLLVAVLPGIGEELIFRGILLKQLSEWLRRPVMAVWVTALIFSALHMQFESFLPRLVLGAVLGYLYIWTRNLWIPIIVHAINNSIPIVTLYFSGIDLSDMERMQDKPLSIWLILGSAVVLILCYRALRKQGGGHETA